MHRGRPKPGSALKSDVDLQKKCMRPLLAKLHPSQILTAFLPLLRDWRCPVQMAPPGTGWHGCRRLPNLDGLEGSKHVLVVPTWIDFQFQDGNAVQVKKEILNLCSRALR